MYKIPDLEAHGGIYTLHSHINHSCMPNISVRHLDQRTALSRITIIAQCDIDVGQELVVTYVNPEMRVRERRQALAAWGFGVCQCGRCIEEEQEMDLKGTEDELGDLERELKVGLGIM